MNKPVLTSLTRTPMGKLLGAFSNTSAAKLGSIVVKEAVKRSQLDPVEGKKTSEK